MMDATVYDKVAIFEELDRERPGRETADHLAEVTEYGEFNEAGGTLSRADFEDARENL